MNISQSSNRTDSAASRRLLSSFCCLVVLGFGTFAHGQIVPTGDVSPVYDNTDPWNVPGGVLVVGDSGSGELDVLAGSNVITSTTTVGNQQGSNGIVRVDGSGTIFDANFELTVGDSGSGTLEVTSNAFFSANGNVYIARNAGSHGEMTVNNAFPSALGNFYVGSSGNGTLNVVNSNFVMFGTFDLGTNGTGQMLLTSGSLAVVGESTIGANAGSEGIATVGSSGTFTATSDLIVGASGKGTLLVNPNGNVFADTNTTVGRNSGGDGSITVTGDGSRLETALSLTVGDQGKGVLNVEAGAIVTSGTATVGQTGLTDNIVTVTGGGSRFEVDGNLIVGEQGKGVLNVEAGALVTSGNATVGLSSPADGTATVNGANSHWQITGNLSVSNTGSGTLNVDGGGKVSVTGTTTLPNPAGVINLNGGRFEFGTMTVGDFQQVNGVSGSLAGDLGTQAVTGLNDIASTADGDLFVIGLKPLQQQFSNIAGAVDTSEVIYGAGNSGLLFGDGVSPYALTNNTQGEVEVITGERMRFDGSNSTNAGQVTLAGGQVQFTQTLTNQSGGQVTLAGGQLRADQGFANESGGLVFGNGSLRADGGLTNDGTMAYSATSNVIGDVTNNAAGLITSSGGTTTFFDDVTNNGEIRTNTNSFSVYFGSYSGNGDTGTGTVIMEGDLKPGFSPGITAFGGDLMFGENASLDIELAGLIAGSEYDQVTVANDLILNGLLDVELLDNFSLGLGQQFDILTVDGELTGEFSGLSEGSLVGNFGGIDLFITYAAGSGNDVALFTPVPEPSTFISGLIGALGVVGLIVRRRVA